MKIFLPLIAALFLNAGLARAEEAKKPEAAAPAPAVTTAPAATEKKLTAPQQRMKDCSKEAGDKKGDARRDFMRQCMHGDKAGTGMQQNRMKECNKEAGDKRGPDRRAFMSECLKKK